MQRPAPVARGHTTTRRHPLQRPPMLLPCGTCPPSRACKTLNQSHAAPTCRWAAAAGGSRASARRRPRGSTPPAAPAPAGRPAGQRHNNVTMSGLLYSRAGFMRAGRQSCQQVSGVHPLAPAVWQLLLRVRSAVPGVFRQSTMLQRTAWMVWQPSAGPTWMTSGEPDVSEPRRGITSCGMTGSTRAPPAAGEHSSSSNPRRASMRYGSCGTRIILKLNVL